MTGDARQAGKEAARCNRQGGRQLDATSTTHVQRQHLVAKRLAHHRRACRQGTRAKSCLAVRACPRGRARQGEGGRRAGAEGGRKEQRSKEERAKEQGKSKGASWGAGQACMRSHAHSLAALPHLFSEVAVCLGVFNDYMKHVPRYHVLLVLKPFKMYAAHTHTHTATLEWEQRAQAKTQEDMQTDREKDKQRDICKRPTHARADASGDAKRRMQRDTHERRPAIPQPPYICMSEPWSRASASCRSLCPAHAPCRHT